MSETPDEDSVPRSRWPSGPFGSDAAHYARTSLFLQILDWLLAPLLLLWPLSIAFTNHYAHQIADEPYDGALVEAVQILSQYLEGLEHVPPPRLPRAVQTALTGDGIDSRSYRVSAALPTTVELTTADNNEFPLEVYGSGNVIRGRRIRVVAPSHFDLGEVDIPVIESPPTATRGKVHLRDDDVNGESVRVASRVMRAFNGELLLVQVAETRVKREAMVSRIIRGVLLPQFAMIPLAVILTWFGLSYGLRPLRRLRERMMRRRPGDLSPMGVRGVPDEVRPLILSMNDMMSRLEVNLQAQQRFIADAAHQLKTPLTGLKMQADLAADETDPVRLRRSVRLIAESAERAAHLTNQLLTLARTEASHDKLHRFEPVDLRALARSVTIEWAERALSKEIDLAFDSGDWPQMSEGVPLLLREALSNLIDNAIKYTPVGGRVTVRVRSTEFIVVEVEDTGIGIAPAERDKVFERFYRVLGTEASGSGLGLPIVQEIIDLHRGRIDVLDGDGGGTLFRVSLIRRGGVIAPQELRPD